LYFVVALYNYSDILILMISEVKSDVMRIPDSAHPHGARPGGTSRDAEVAEPHLTFRIDRETADFASPWIRAAQLPELFCSWDLAYRCTRGGWLRPIVQGKRRTIYRLADVLVCM
jgi:hypothetical protein